MPLLSCVPPGSEVSARGRRERAMPIATLSALRGLVRSSSSVLVYLFRRSVLIMHGQISSMHSTSQRRRMYGVGAASRGDDCLAGAVAPGLMLVVTKIIVVVIVASWHGAFLSGWFENKKLPGVFCRPHVTPTAAVSRPHCSGLSCALSGWWRSWRHVPPPAGSAPTVSPRGPCRPKSPCNACLSGARPGSH